MRPLLWIHCCRSRGIFAAAFLLLGALVLFQSGLVGARTIHAQALPNIRYSSSSQTLTLGRPYLPLKPEEAAFVTNPSHPDAPKRHITLPDLQAWAVAEGVPALLQEQEGIWTVAVHITIEDTAQLDLTGSSGVREMRLISRPTAAYTLIADGGTLLIDGIKVYSWDDSPGMESYDSTFLTKNGIMQTRAFLAALYGGRMDIRNAEIMHLGYEERNERVGYGKGEPSGISWRLRPPGTTEPASGPKGSIINSKVHHNYFGMYSYEATGLEIRDSEFYSHYFYGLDPHDYSHGFVVANNVIRDNGYTGLIFSRHCTDNEIYGNEIYNNGAHGFMLDRGSDRNVFRDNQVYANASDGIAIYQSSQNVITDNRVQNNQRSGLRISAEFDPDDLYDGLATDNLVANNFIADNGRDGIYIVDRADYNRILGNRVERNGRSGLLLNSGLSTVQQNWLANNGREGILLSDESYRAGEGPAGQSRPPLGAPATANQLLGNRLWENREHGIVIDGGRANQIGSLGAGNVITQNVGSGILLKATGAITITHNQISDNVADNGAGIRLQCGGATMAPTPLAYITDNMIVNNQATDMKGRGAGILVERGCLAQINHNRIYGNTYASGVANVQTKTVAGSSPLDATANIWTLTDPAAVEQTIWHQVDDAKLAEIIFEPLGTGSITPPPTPSPTPTLVDRPTPVPPSTPTPHPQGEAAQSVYLPSLFR